MEGEREKWSFERSRKLLYLLSERSMADVDIHSKLSLIPKEHKELHSIFGGFATSSMEHSRFIIIHALLSRSECPTHRETINKRGIWTIVLTTSTT